MNISRLTLSALAVPVLMLTACGKVSRPSKNEIERLIRDQYPVIVPAEVPQNFAAEIGSQEHRRLQQFKENLDRTGWFESKVERVENRKDPSKRGERFFFRLTPNAPRTIKTKGESFLVPAAEVVFMALGPERHTGDKMEVKYRVQMSNETPQFPLFKLFHANAAIGQTQERVARFTKVAGQWQLVGTNENPKFYKK